LWGIIAGIATKWLLTCWFTSTAHIPATAAVGNGHAAALIEKTPFAWQWLRTLSNPVAHRESIDDEHHIYFHGPLVSFNLLHVNGELARTPPTAKRVFLHLTDHVPLVDHTSCERLLHFRDECDRNGTAAVELVGLERMAARSTFPSCMRTRRSRLVPAQSSDRCDSASANFEHTTSPTETVHCRTANDTSEAKDEGGMTWISLSDPTADFGPDESPDQQDQARADMDWLDLEKASGEERPQRDRDAQSRADMDWLDLEHAVGGPAGPGGALAWLW
jgi:hypothetical protein